MDSIQEKENETFFFDKKSTIGLKLSINRKLYECGAISQEMYHQAQCMILQEQKA